MAIKNIKRWKNKNQKRKRNALQIIMTQNRTSSPKTSMKMRVLRRRAQIKADYTVHRFQSYSASTCTSFLAESMDNSHKAPSINVMVKSKLIVNACCGLKASELSAVGISFNSDRQSQIYSCHHYRYEAKRITNSRVYKREIRFAILPFSSSNICKLA